jgi:4-amino-4-deoxy-L-arabinose transferase-like glycosyltransferase
MFPQKTVMYLFASLIFLCASYHLYNQVNTTKAHCDIDSSAYLERGDLFYQTNRFVTDQNPDQPYYALGYPLIIGLLYKVVGGQSTLAIILLQLLLSLLSCFLIMALANRLFGETAAIIAALLFAVNIGYLTFAQFVLTELVLSFCYLLFFERLTAQRYAQAALALGCSVLIKPAALYLAIPIAFWLLITTTGPWLRRVTATAVFIGCFAVPVLGYLTYNYHAFDHFGFGPLDRINLYYWFLPNVLAAKNDTSSDTERLQLQAMATEPNDFAAVSAVFWRTVREQPLLCVKVWMTNVVKTGLGLYTTNLKVLVEPDVHGGDISFFKEKSLWGYIKAGATKSWVVAVGIFEVVYSALRYLLCLAAFLVFYRRRQHALLLLCFGVLGYFFMITGHDGCARFRMMIEWLLIVLAAGGLDALVPARRHVV